MPATHQTIAVNSRCPSIFVVVVDAVVVVFVDFVVVVVGIVVVVVVYVVVFVIVAVVFVVVVVFVVAVVVVSWSNLRSWMLKNVASILFALYHIGYCTYKFGIKALLISV